MEVTSMHLGQRVSCNCNVTDSLLISAPLASDALLLLLLRCCPQLLPASSLPFPPCSMPSDRLLRLPPFRLIASQRTGASYALAMCTVASRDGSGCRFFVLLASSPPVLPIFSVPPSISFADLFCRGDLDTQKHSVSHCLGDALKTMVELTFIWPSGLLCLAHYVRYSNHHNSLLVLVIFVTGKLIFRAFFWFPCNHT